MRCPHCSVAEIPEDSSECQLCGYSMGRSQQVGLLAPDELDERVRAEMGQEFLVERELWRTAESRSYVALDVMNRTQVLTVVHRSGSDDPALEGRFRRAAQVAGLLDHPHIVPMHGAGGSATLLWCSSKLIEGRPLSRVLREMGPLDLPACLRMVEQIGSALDHAHRRGISHGDVTAENILVDANDWAFLTHFGITQALRGTSLTKQGGPSGDQRDLGVLVERCLNLPAEAAGIPASVVQAVGRAASPEPAARFATVLDFVAALASGPGVLPDRLTAAAPVRRKTPSLVLMPVATPAPGLSVSRPWWKYAVGGVLVAACLAWLLWPKAEPPSVAYSVLALPREALDTAPVPEPASPRPARPVTPVRSRVADPEPAQPRRVTPPAPPPSAPAGKGQLFVNSMPWGQVYIDGTFIGNTPQVDLSIGAGPHILRLVRDGFQPLERQIVVAAGADLRLTDLVLSPR